MSYAYLLAAALVLGGCAAPSSTEATTDEAALVGGAGPEWVGNAKVAIARDTCGGALCDYSLGTVYGDIVYGTWARERAAVRAFTFEVYAPGLTETKSPDLWQHLDVQVHSRIAGRDAFEDHYVPLDRFVGNNARYALDLRTLDPLVGTIGCPARMQLVGGDVEIVVEMFVTVNGVELRPSGADSVYRVRYQNYATLFSGCLK